MIFHFKIKLKHKKTNINMEKEELLLEIECKYGFYTYANKVESFCETCNEGDNYEDNGE
jgi:hypothetical protein